MAGRLRRGSRMFLKSLIIAAGAARRPYLSIFFPMKELSAIARQLFEDTAAGAVLATLVTVQGSSYRRPGARLLLTADGRRLGSISGGCLEEDVLARARAVAASGRAELVVYDTTSENDLVWGVGLGCHGVVQVLLERLPARPVWAMALAAGLGARRPLRLDVTWQADDPAALGTRVAHEAAAPAGTFREEIRPRQALVVFGAGDDAQPLVRLADELGWWITVADPRAAFATKQRFPAAERLIIGPAKQLVHQVNPEAGAVAVVMTHHYVHDLPLLRDLLPRPLAYLGLLGPRKRAEGILDDLRAEGVEVIAEQRALLHAPVGLDLGAETPEEVALSILAEMQAVLAGREARPLRERTKPIH
jgi:xanthine dehydrogenase accessory factor